MRAGVAAGQPNGAACSRATDCASYRCVDGVCCNAGCTGQCEACNLPALAGTCSPVTGQPVGARTACPGSGPCKGACDGVNRTSCVFPGPTVSCGAPTCTNDVQTTYACSGTGACTPTTTSCGRYRCRPDGSACQTGCASDADCVGGICCRNLMNLPCDDEQWPCCAGMTCRGGSCQFPCPLGAYPCGATCCANRQHCVNGTCQCVELQGACDPANNLCCLDGETHCPEFNPYGSSNTCCRPQGGHCSSAADCCREVYDTGIGQRDTCGDDGRCGAAGGDRCVGSGKRDGARRSESSGRSRCCSWWGESAKQHYSGDELTLPDHSR